MTLRRGRLLAGLPEPSAPETFETWVSRGGVAIERIVSPPGHASPADFWYDQERAEWVMVLEGEAALELEGQKALIELQRGDWVEIPAGLRHRVAWTSVEEPTIWLAVHYPA